ncbi:MAG: hypothetical protein SV487_11920 [Thermodesulfobacteriota bacterium]|nr:hypothetical protein [Thermodesulfobacteriota bacterium]
MTDDTQTLNEKLTALEAELKSVLINQALREAAQASRAVNPDQVAALLGNDLDLNVNEERQVFLADKEDRPLLDEQGQPVSLDKTVAAWLGKNPHLIKPVGRFGAGSQSGPGLEEDVFTPEQLADPEYYRANRNRIHKFLNRR